MATVENNIKIDVTKEAKDLVNAKSLMKLEETQTPEIDPSNFAVNDTKTVNNIENSTDIAVLSDTNSQDLTCDNDCVIPSGSRINKVDGCDKKLVATEVTSHPLQDLNDDAASNVEEGTEALEENAPNKRDRRVFFPEDGRIVSGYMEPPSPWNDASTCSTEELIEAYKKSCDRFGVKPLPRLMQQLHVINDFSDRNETLTLRGERLDLKHCETVEEILRRVQFRTFDLENTHLDDESTVALFDMIEHYESCNRLNISNNRTIGVRGWQACARLMKKTPCLENLEARNCVISEQVMPFFCRSLKMGSCLTVLHLENSIMSGRHLIVLTQALKINDNLNELYLADNKLMPSDGIQLGNLLRYNFRLQLLDVRNNHLQDVGTSHICDGIWEQNLGRGLATIVLWNNQITYQAMNALSRALANTKSLETLNLGHNNITNEGIHRLKDGLLHNKSLLRIGLQASKISCEGAVALAEFIAESPRLRRIDLRENDIKTGGLMGLSLSLKVSQSVTRIDLDKEPKREITMKDYVEQQHRLLNDINNYMQRNRDLARVREEEEKEEKERQLREEQAAAERQVQEETTEISDPATQPDLPLDDQTEKSDPSKEEEIQVVEEPDQDCEVAGKVLTQRPIHLNLPNCTGSRTLDSPAFVTEDNLPPFPTLPPSERPASFQETIVNSNEIPLFFPPSPMVSNNGRPTLAPILGSAPSVMSPESSNVSMAVLSQSQNVGGLQVNIPKEVLRKSPLSSPTQKRKFIISRVQEPSKQKKTVSDTPDVERTGDKYDQLATDLSKALAVAVDQECSGTEGDTSEGHTLEGSVATGPAAHIPTDSVDSGGSVVTVSDVAAVSRRSETSHLDNSVSAPSAQPALSSPGASSNSPDEVGQEGSDKACHSAVSLTEPVNNNKPHDSAETSGDSVSHVSCDNTTTSVLCSEQATPSSGDCQSDSSLVGAASHSDCTKSVSELSSLNGVRQNVMGPDAEGMAEAGTQDSIPQLSAECTSSVELEEELDSLLAEVTEPITT